MAVRKDDPNWDIRFYETVLRRAPGYIDVIEILGGLYTRTGRIADGLRMDRKLVRIQPHNATAHYNLACSLALSDRKADAIRALRRAIELGYRDHEWMTQDPDLEALKGVSAFDNLLGQLQPES